MYYVKVFSFYILNECKIYIPSVFADDLKFRDKFETQQELQKSTQYNFCEMGFSLWRCFVWIRTETHSLFDVSLSFSVEKVRSQFTLPLISVLI